MNQQKNIIDHPDYLKSRKQLEEFFTKNDTRPTKINGLSPSGKYSLHTLEVETRKGCWNYVQGIITNTETDEVVAEVKRNYGSFPYLFIEHPNGNDYLVCGEDYQGYTVVNLTAKKTSTFIPEGWLKGVGFCWAKYKFNRETQTLIVDGCYWGCPYEVVTYDFSNPDQLPFREIDRKDYEYKDEDDE